jgi:hypothetical protein
MDQKGDGKKVLQDVSAHIRLEVALELDNIEVHTRMGTNWSPCFNQILETALSTYYFYLECL